MADTTKTLSTEAAESPHLRDLVRNVLDDVSRLVRAEITLARTELKETARQVVRPGAVLAGAAIAGLLAAACFVATSIAALALVMPVWLGALVIGILLAIVAGAGFALGRTKLKGVDLVPQQTVQTIRENLQWAKDRTE